eukprot:7003408-Prymnesium_polylepis.1
MRGTARQPTTKHTRRRGCRERPPLSRGRGVELVVRPRRPLHAPHRRRRLLEVGLHRAAALVPVGGPR